MLFTTYQNRKGQNPHDIINNVVQQAQKYYDQHRELGGIQSLELNVTPVEGWERDDSMMFCTLQMIQDPMNRWQPVVLELVGQFVCHKHAPDKDVNSLWDASGAWREKLQECNWSKQAIDHYFQDAPTNLEYETALYNLRCHQIMGKYNTVPILTSMVTFQPHMAAFINFMSVMVFCRL